MSPAVIPPIIPIAVIAKRNRIIRHFNKAAAHTPQTALTLESLSITRGHIFGRMIKSGVIREEAGGRFWLDEAAKAAGERRATKAVVIAFGVVGVVGAVVVIVMLTR